MKIVHVAALGAMLLSSGIHAQSTIGVKTLHEDDDLVVRRGEIHVEDLDLRYETARRALDLRLQRAARRVCAEDNISGLPDFDVDCYRDVLAQGRVQGGRLTSAALAKGTSPRLTALSAPRTESGAP